MPSEKGEEGAASNLLHCPDCGYYHLKSDGRCGLKGETTGTLNSPIVGDWNGVLPEYIRWLHRAGVEQGMADNYIKDYIMVFEIQQVDTLMCESLEGIERVWLVYRRREL